MVASRAKLEIIGLERNHKRVHTTSRLQSVLLLLTEAGLAACAQADWAMYAPTVAAALDLPAGLQLACGIAIGHADPARPINAVRTTRDDPLSLP